MALESGHGAASQNIKKRTLGLTCQQREKRWRAGGKAVLHLKVKKTPFISMNNAVFDLYEPGVCDVLVSMV